MAELTLDSLIRRGYFHDHAIPPLTSSGLADSLPNLPLERFDPNQDLWRQPSHSRLVRHSVPKRKLSRRVLSIPNPQHQIPLCLKLQECWSEIERHFQISRMSLSTPTIRDKSLRSVGLSVYIRDLSPERMVRSVGCRFHLYADFARYYASIYTHSIAWALHGQNAARADERTNRLIGNQIDRLVRATQDRQSIGIPVGPDSSFIIAEIIACSVDERLQSAGMANGIRYIDDFHFYFRSRGECEKAIAELHGACRQYELDINDAKTVIEELPDVCEPAWKVALRMFPLGASKSPDEDLLSFFNLAFRLSLEHPSDGVLKYAVGKASDVSYGDFGLYISLLCRCAIAEPACLPEFLKIVVKHRVELFLWPGPLPLTIEEICRYHAPLQHGYEVAWALWVAVQLRIRISDEVARLISMMDDDSVALVTLHGAQLGLLNPDPGLVWRSWLTKDQLNLDHWLAAYELAVKGWVLPENGADYVSEHPFFSVLRANGVVFYDVGPAASGEIEVNI